jgi:hypothetical protein
MPGQETSGGKGQRICPPPPKGFDPFTASKVDLARHGLPLRPDPQTQPDLAALWDRLAGRYRDFEHLQPRPGTVTAGKKAAVDPALGDLVLDPVESCGYSLSGSQVVPFIALFATWTVPNLQYSSDPYGPNYFRTFVSLGSLDIHTEMSVDSAQNVTCGLWAEDIGAINLPVSPGDVISGALCLDTRSPRTAHYFLANHTTLQTINYTVPHTGFDAAVTIAAGVSRSGWDHPNPSLAQFGVVYFDEISAYRTSGHQPFPLGGNAITMLDENGTTLAKPDMLTDYTFKTIFVAA